MHTLQQTKKELTAGNDDDFDSDYGDENTEIKDDVSDDSNESCFVLPETESRKMHPSSKRFTFKWMETNYTNRNPGNVAYM